jgi:S1-C subfamily serine protease
MLAAVLAVGAGSAVAFNRWSAARAALAASASHSGPAAHSGAGRSTGSLVANALGPAAEPGIVEVASAFTYGHDYEYGTGMVISSSGLVLTNEHVIDGGVSVTATLVSSGQFYLARVVGYDATADVALLQLVGASGLKTVTLSDSSKAKLGEAVSALGDAGGPSNPLSITHGIIRGLDLSARVGDSAAASKEMHGMIESNARTRPGDSGGPLLNSVGAVIGMDTAGNTSGQGPDPSSAITLAIPINTVLSIASQIRSGKASSAVHIGLAAYLGVNVVDASSAHPCASGSDDLGFDVSSPASSGALICEVDPYGPAWASLGLTTSVVVIVAVNGTAIGSAADLAAVTAAARPGDTFAIEYVGKDGTSGSCSVTLAGWVKPLFGQPVI